MFKSGGGETFHSSSPPTRQQIYHETDENLEHGASRYYESAWSLFLIGRTRVTHTRLQFRLLPE